MSSPLAARSSALPSTSYETDTPVHLPPRDRIPTEILDDIIAWAVKYTQGDANDPFYIQDKHSTDATRRDIRLVCKIWKVLADKHIFRDIQFGERSPWDLLRVDDYCPSDAHDAFHALCTSTLERPLVLSDLRILAVYADPRAPPRYKRPRKRTAKECLRATSAELALVLSHSRRLEMFAVRSDYSLLGLKMLGQPTCAQGTLTHLDIDVDQTPCSFVVHGLNALHNLVWLRVCNTGKFDPDILKADEELDPSDLPELSLPKLRELELLGEHDDMDETPISFHIARRALLPSLVRLRIHAPWCLDEDGFQEIARFASTLRHLDVKLPYDALMYSISTHAPHLETLTYSMGEMEDDDDECTWVLAHPTLRRLVLDPRSEWKGPLRSIDPALCPMLETIQFRHYNWSTDSQRPEGATAIWVAIELAAKGIAVLDDDGKLFGGLSVAGARKETEP